MTRVGHARRLGASSAMFFGAAQQLAAPAEDAMTAYFHIAGDGRAVMQALKKQVGLRLLTVARLR
ncbi:MAG: hypothetical protein N3C12_12830 [Candidatus Binatia bacterium]|nr:hypothetical protein [Candidatus Binatia bacterium]